MNVKAELKDFLGQCKRVLKVSRKPGKDEYLNFAKVTGAGIALIGAIGFIIYIVGSLINL
ncbi:MAG: protein translocase SEC61 complex subunit gamma [Methanobrevibacter sp.]|jgi:protein transport protein SEC61 subunit gamma-like protein|nr:protein translocase SEC61 complex subunit gamma [Candidatus Methanovirga aequatorialis]